MRGESPIALYLMQDTDSHCSSTVFSSETNTRIDFSLNATKMSGLKCD